MGPLHSELLEEPSSRVFPLAPAGKSDPVWEMDTLPVGKEWGQAGEQGDTQQPQASSQACLQGWEGKEGKLLGGTRKEKSRERGRSTQVRGAQRLTKVRKQRGRDAQQQRE